MKRFLKWFIAGLMVMGVSTWAFGAGSAYQLTGYATAGANPAVVFVVTDSQGNGVRGAAVNVTCNAGTLDVTAGTTGADGTLTVRQSSGALGNQITGTCASVSIGSPLAITSAVAQTVKGTDTVLVWHDESRRLVNAAVVSLGLGVLTSNATFNVTTADNTANNHSLALGQAAGLSQSAAGPAQVEVMQGTFFPGDVIRVDETTVTGSPNGTMTGSATPVTRRLNAFASGGVDPQLWAVVTDNYGVGVEGVTVTAACSGGSLLAATAYTNADGYCTFQQNGGSLGDTLTVSCTVLPETSPVLLFSKTSPAVAASNKVFAWFARKTRLVRTAVTDRGANVLVSSAAMLQDFTNFNGNNLYVPQSLPSYGGTFINQNATKPGLSGCLPFGGNEASDTVRLYESTGVYRYSTYHCIIDLPANESRYLMAFASGGANPTVWAVVTNGGGNAVPNVPVHFALAGTGTLSQSDTVTCYSGYAQSLLTGGALGNTLTVSSPGLGMVTLYTAPAQTPTLTDRVYTWFNSANQDLFAAPISLENNVMCVDGTTVTADGVDNHAGHNYPYTSGFTPVAAPNPCFSHVGYGNVEGGDFVRIYNNYTSNYWDSTIIADPNPAKFLVAFASGGVDPKVWAVVMDSKCNALENEPVTITTAQGTVNVPNGTAAASINTVTGWGGWALAQHTSGLLGNTITVSAPGLQPVTIYTAAPVNYTGADRGAWWYDPSRGYLWGAQWTFTNHVITANQNGWYSTSWDNTANNRTLSFDSVSGYNMSRTVNPLAFCAIAQGTAGVGDEVRMYYGSEYGFIRFNTMRSTYLRAYASSGTNPSLVRAMVLDQDGLGQPNVSVSFSASHGNMLGGPFWKTGLDGTVDTSQTSGLVNDIITVSSPGYPDVQIYTYSSGGINGSSNTLAWYSRTDRKVNCVVTEYLCYNVLASGALPSITFVPTDLTPGNYKTAAITGPMQDTAQSMTYGYIAPGTTGAGDLMRVQTQVTAAGDDVNIFVPTDASRYLFAFGTGGADPKVTAVVTDANGNGVSGVPVHLTYPGPVTVDLVTDAGGTTSNTRAGVALTSVIVATADGVGNSINVKASAALDVAATARAMGWYDVPALRAYAAFVNVPENILANNTNAGFTPVDATSNGLAFAVGSSTNQTASAPAFCPVTTGTQGQGDIVRVKETTLTAANPDMELAINVPVSGIMSSLVTTPDPVITGNTLTVTMSVFNNGSYAAENVSPTALSLAGGASLLSGPTPAFFPTLPGGTAQDFTWTYRATAPGGLTFTGQALATDSYTTLGLTSTSTNANPVLVRDPLPPVLVVSALGVTPNAVLTYQSVTVTMTVLNNSSTDVPDPLTVTPSALLLGGSGALTPASGPTPATWYIPRGESRDFTWMYTGTVPGGVTLTGQAYTVNPFDASGVTATAVMSETVLVRDPNVPVIVSTLSAIPAVRTVGQSFNLIMSVANNSDAEVPNALTVTPSALTIAGPGSLTSGPDVASQIIGRGESRNFTWIITTTGAGSITVTAQAYTVNPFNAAGVTSTATASNPVLSQSAPNLLSDFSVPSTVERLSTFTVSLAVRNQGQALAVSVTPTNFVQAGTAPATWVSGPTPAAQDIPGGESRIFTWQYKAGLTNGNIQYSARAQGSDQNTGLTVQSPLVNSASINVIQGVINLDSVSVSAPLVYRGQKGLQVTLQAHNTSVMGVTLTASNLTFNNAQTGFTVVPDPSNPVLLPPQSHFTLRFNVDVGKDAPLGNVVVNASVVGDAGPAGTLSADGAQQPAAWEVLEAFNQLQQNYPNPLKLAQNAFTTFVYYVQDDVKVSLKLYNLAGELVAVLVDGQPGVGMHRAVWNGANGDVGQRGSTVGSGVYIAVFQSGEYKEMRKVVVIR